MKMYKLWLLNKETGKKEFETYNASSLENAVDLFRSRYDVYYEYVITQIKEIKE